METPHGFTKVVVRKDNTTERQKVNQTFVRASASCFAVPGADRPTDFTSKPGPRPIAAFEQFRVVVPPVRPRQLVGGRGPIPRGREGD